LLWDSSEVPPGVHSHSTPDVRRGRWVDSYQFTVRSLESTDERALMSCIAAIPPLRGPTRHNSARKRKSGRSGRDDSLGQAKLEVGSQFTVISYRLSAFS